MFFRIVLNSQMAPDLLCLKGPVLVCWGALRRVPEVDLRREPSPRFKERSLPMRRRRYLAVVLALTMLMNPSVSLAWNETGHRIVAYIAYQQLDGGTRDRVFAALQAHPGMGTDLWSNGGINGPDKKLNAFLNAATFPDDVKSSQFMPTTKFHDGTFKQYDKRIDHYINIGFDSQTTVSDTPSIPTGESLLSTYKLNVATVRDQNAADKDQAVALSWIFHQVGDVHQPLHAATRISDKYPAPEGDGGGNKVDFPNPRGHKDFHSYWDDMLGAEASANNPAKLKHVADLVTTAYPASAFTASDLAASDDATPWAIESYKLAVSKAYGPIGGEADDGVSDVSELPDGYLDSTKEVAKRRLALAGYRLAEELKTLFPGP